LYFVVFNNQVVVFVVFIFVIWRISGRNVVSQAKKSPAPGFAVVIVVIFAGILLRKG
jgi:uncharacterized membrane protein YcaP (DUF421 family)